MGRVQKSFSKYKRIIFGFTAGIVLVFLIIGSVFIMEDRKNTATLELMITPMEAKVMIGGKVYETIGEYKMKPGEYEMEVSMDGFDRKTETIKLFDGETTKIWLYLSPNDDNSDWYEKNPDDALLLGEMKSKETELVLDQIMKTMPELKQLPIEIEYYSDDYTDLTKYTVSYEVVNDKVVIMINDYTGGNYEDALEKLEARGFNTKVLEIEYHDRSEENGKAF